jgi:hypothetical protein
MVKKIFVTLAAVGVACFMFIFFWVEPKVQSYLDKSDYLIERGLIEEAESYRIEGETLSDWILPIAEIGFVLVVLPTIYFFWTFKNAKQK